MAYCHLTFMLLFSSQKSELHAKASKIFLGDLKTFRKWDQEQEVYCSQRLWVLSSLNCSVGILVYNELLLRWRWRCVLKALRLHISSWSGMHEHCVHLLAHICSSGLSKTSAEHSIHDLFFFFFFLKSGACTTCNMQATPLCDHSVSRDPVAVLCVNIVGSHIVLFIHTGFGEAFQAVVSLIHNGRQVSQLLCCSFILTFRCHELLPNARVLTSI